MSEGLVDIRTGILEAALPSVAFDGWRMATLEEAAEQAGYGRDMARAVFPGGLPDALDFFADLTDRKMLARLENVDMGALRVRDRVKLAVMARIRVMEEEREAEILAIRYWSRPDRQPRAARLVWRTADRIWERAGDESKDYNFYTKRGLLTGVIGATTLAWLNDDSPGLQVTERFLERRIGNVMTLGGFIGKLKGKPGFGRSADKRRGQG